MTKVKTVCSRCGAPSGDDEDLRSSYDVSKAEIEMYTGRKISVTIDPPGFCTIHDIKAVKIESESGERYPEAKYVKAKIIDCCRKCFTKHALPALVAAGFHVRIEDRSW